MASKQPPPLTPADSDYLGLDTKGYHVLHWRSQSREGATYETRIHKDTGLASCTCPSFVYRSWCKHVEGAWDAVRHHLYPPSGPPPADPGGAVGEPPELAGLTECEDAARDELRSRYAECMANLYGH